MFVFVFAVVLCFLGAKLNYFSDIWHSFCEKITKNSAKFTKTAFWEEKSYDKSAKNPYLCSTIIRCIC